MSFNNWHTANPDAVGPEENQPPEAGPYEVVLVDAGAFTSKKGDDWVKMRWRDLCTEHEWDVLNGFKSQAQANFTKREVRELGVDVDSTECSSLEGLDTVLKRMIGGFYSVEVVQNGEFLNTYLRGRMTADIPAPEPVAAAPTGTHPDDDIPFLHRPAAWEDRYHGWSHFA